MYGLYPCGDEDSGQNLMIGGSRFSCTDITVPLAYLFHRRLLLGYQDGVYITLSSCHPPCITSTNDLCRQQR